MNIISFCNRHLHIYNYKCYCEAIIFPDGTISYAKPSHTEKLISIYLSQSNKTREEFWKECPVDDVLAYLLEKTKCIAIWYEFAYHSCEVTALQLKTISILRKKEIINKDFKFSFRNKGLFSIYSNQEYLEIEYEGDQYYTQNPKFDIIINDRNFPNDIIITRKIISTQDCSLFEIPFILYSFEFIQINEEQSSYE